MPGIRQDNASISFCGRPGGPLRLTRANLAFGSNVSKQRPCFRGIAGFITILICAKSVQATQSDTLLINQSARIRGSIRIAEKWNVDVNGGYDFINRELTPTQLDIRGRALLGIVGQLVPIGIRKSIYVRLNIKSSMLKDLKLEFRDSDLPDLFFWSTPEPAHQHHHKAHEEHQEADLVDPVHHAQADAGFFVAVKQVGRVQVVENFLEKHGSAVSVGNDRNFDARALGQSGDKHRFTRREWLGDGGAVGGVHAGIIAGIDEENSGLHHVLQTQSRCLEYTRHIVQALRRRGFDGFSHQLPVLWVQGDLARQTLSRLLRRLDCMRQPERLR